MQRFINQLLPFIFAGIAIVAFAFGIFLLAYLFLIGAIVGLILFSLNWIHRKFFPPKNMPMKRKQGHTYDSDDWKKL